MRQESAAEGLKDALVAAAGQHGFARAGVAEATELEEEGGQLDRWLSAGRHASMTWMTQNAAVRKNPSHAGMLEGATRVVVLAAPYLRRTAPLMPLGRVAKYAMGRDYHNVLTKRARKVARVLVEAGYRARIAVDTKPIFERAWAERSGIGFVGKNCCLIVPGLGSHLFLSCIVTDAPLDVDAPMSRRCGDCTLCLDGCPTDAFEGPRELDARACISYLTIEHREPVAPEFRDGIGDWLFGCDVCQDVCPYNQTQSPTQGDDTPFQPHARWDGLDATDFLEMDDDAFATWAAGSPIKRARREGMARNAAIVLGNKGDKRHLPLLQRTARDACSDMEREAAAWAISKIAERD